MEDDSDDDSPIQGLLDALKMGREPLQRICSLSGASAVTYPRGTLAAVQSLEDTLDQANAKITDSYTQNIREFGKHFIHTLTADYATAGRIQSLTIRLMRQFMSLHRCFDEPSTLETKLIMTLKGETERCCEEALKFLTKAHQHFAHTAVQGQRLPAQPSRIVRASTEPTLITAQYATTSRHAMVQPVKNSFPAREGEGFFDKMTQLDPESAPAKDPVKTYVDASPPAISSAKEHRFSHDSAISGALSLGKSDSPPSGLISSEDVRRRLSANDDFLSRRQRSRDEFEEQFRAEVFLGVHDVTGDSLRIYRHKDRSPTSIAERSSFPSWTPSAKGYSSTVPTLAATLRLPGYGVNVADGIEPVRDEGSSTHSNGLMLLNEGSESTPTASFRSVDYLMRHDSSFYAHGEFCEGAMMMLRGEKDYFKIVKRPAGSKLSFVTDMTPEDVPLVIRAGQFNAAIAVRCAKCMYEVDWSTFKKDNLLDETGIHSIEDHEICYRTSFLSKCHLRAKSVEDTIYACIFCVEENRTLEDHDATVFFSVEQYMRHLMRHPRPVRYIEGIKVCYGNQSNFDFDFDLQFIRMEAKTNPLAGISRELAPLPMARAIVAHHPKAGKFMPKAPDGNPTLQFATGAHIVGITFPTRFNGQWCSGYHDSEHAMFPYNAIHLDEPPKGDVVMDPKSPLVATARWDHRPREPSFGWLTFSKKDKITNVSFPFENHWCYWGKNSKGA